MCLLPPRGDAQKTKAEMNQEMDEWTCYYGYFPQGRGVIRHTSCVLNQRQITKCPLEE